MTPRATLRMVALILLTWAMAVVLPLSVVHVYGAVNKSRAQSDAAFAIADKAMEAVMDMSIGAIVFAARVLSGILPDVKQCTLANQTQLTFSPQTLVATYAAFQLADNAALQGCGVMTAESNTTDTDGSFANKISFEVTNGTIVTPACPTLLYGYTLQDLNYVSYCISESSGEVDYEGGIKYSGPDYGLTSFEQALLSGQNGGYGAIMSPVFDLVGRASISYEVNAGCNTLTFAQTNLDLISRQFAAEFGAALHGGVGYMVEASTGLMLAASVEGQVVALGVTTWGSVTQSRLGPNNASNPVIQHSYNMLVSEYGEAWAAAVLAQVSRGGSQRVSDSDYELQVSHYDYPDSGAPPLDWLKVVVLKRTSYLQASTNIDNRPGLYAAMLVLGLVFISIAFGYLHLVPMRVSEPVRL